MSNHYIDKLQELIDFIKSFNHNSSISLSSDIYPQSWTVSPSSLSSNDSSCDVILNFSHSIYNEQLTIGLIEKMSGWVKEYRSFITLLKQEFRDYTIILDDKGSCCDNLQITITITVPDSFTMIDSKAKHSQTEMYRVYTEYGVLSTRLSQADASYLSELIRWSSNSNMRFGYYSYDQGTYTGTDILDLIKDHDLQSNYNFLREGCKSVKLTREEFADKIAFVDECRQHAVEFVLNTEGSIVPKNHRRRHLPVTWSELLDLIDSDKLFG